MECGGVGAKEGREEGRDKGREGEGREEEEREEGREQGREKAMGGTREEGRDGEEASAHNIRLSAQGYLGLV